MHAVWTKPTGETGIGTGVALTGDTGYFWFFSSSNVELILKVLDGCALNRRNWVFAGGLTDVKVVVTVTDTLYGETETFTNPQGTAFIPIQRTQTGLISATCLPKCSERSFTPAVITQAVDNAVAGLHAPFSDDFGRAMARISDQLQCGLLDEAAASLGRSSGGLHEGRVALPKTDPIYDPSVDYCGKGDSSTGSLAVAFTGDTYVNQACHDHDLCYQQHCIATICYFCPQSYDAAVCDQPLSYACRNKPHLNIFDHIVCKLVQDIPKIQPFGLLCSGPSCTNGQVCNQQSGQCEGRCSNSIFPTSESFGASSVAGKVSVIAAAGCRWTAESNDNWITIVSGSRDPATGGSNVASGAVLYVLEANLGSEARTGTMYIADRTFRVTQAGSSSCSYSINATSQPFGSSGGFGSVNVTASSGCPWTAVSHASWITITSGSSGTGKGTVNYLVAANPDTSQRTGTMTIAGTTFTVTQAAGNSPCSYSIGATSQPFGSSGGPGSVNVTAASGCAWTAVSNNNWITITSGNGGSGNGTVNYSVAANPGTSQRTGTMTIAGLAFAVIQAGNTASGYYYANWNCHNQSQCIDVIGHNVGSAGPFCSSAACTTWEKTYILGTCDAQPLYPIYYAPSPGACFN